MINNTQTSKREEKRKKKMKKRKKKEKKKKEREGVCMHVCWGIVKCLCRQIWMMCVLALLPPCTHQCDRGYGLVLSTHSFVRSLFFSVALIAASQTVNFIS